MTLKLSAYKAQGLQLGFYKLGVACLLVLMLVGCSGKTQPTPPQQVIINERATHPNPEVEAQLIRLDAAVMLTQQQRHQESLDLLQTLRLSFLPLHEHWRALQTAATSSLALENGWLALRLMEHFSQQLPPLNQQQQYLLFGYQADAFLLTGFYSNAVQQRYHQAQATQDKNKQQAAYKALWSNLLQINGETLSELQEQEKYALLRGWLELALVRQTITEHPELFISNLEAWHTAWPKHPAQIFMPEEMHLLTKLSQQQVQHLGVFLPETGIMAGSANALRDALIARQLDTINRGYPAPKITFYDTEGTSLDALYKQAVSDGVEVVIGPLAKAQVDLLERRSSLPLPTLALNYGNDEAFRNKSLYQFGLSAENEAEQVALKAWQSGFRRALVLTPESDWGTRIKESFVNAWQKLGGEITHSRQYGKNLTLDKSLRELLEVQLSEQRHRRLITLLGQRPHFTPRPREDSDFLFIHATAADARQIKPALSFLRASNLPVLATSSVYTGTSDPSRDKDMDGIAFCDIPWYLEEGNALEQTIRQTWPDKMVNYGRLYAMGADAYLLAQRLPLFNALPASRLDGATGRLSQTNRRINRELQWAQFNKGRVEPLTANAFEKQPLIDQLTSD
ncbi:MAG: hypothetical protein GX029_01375 [Pseudomonadaceae bacterium]|nr:hypothetical protein [Pseudomonadaceae bacterium]